MNAPPRSTVIATRVSQPDRHLIEALASARSTTVSKILGELAVRGATEAYRRLLEDRKEDESKNG